MKRHIEVKRHIRRLGVNRIINVSRHLRRLSPFDVIKNKTVYIFVYGTLMNGKTLNYMLKDQIFISEYKLKNHRRIWPRTTSFPIIIKEEGKSVNGEIFFLDDQASEIIDDVELNAGYEIRYFLYQLQSGKQVSVKYYYPLPKLQKTWESILEIEQDKKRISPVIRTNTPKGLSKK